MTPMEPMQVDGAAGAIEADGADEADGAAGANETDEADGAEEADGADGADEADGQADGPGAPQCKAPILWKWRLAPEINPMQHYQ